MNEKKKRLLPMQSPPDLYELIGRYDPDTDAETFVRRRRDGGAGVKNNPWEEFDVKTEGLNTSTYVYELQTGPRLRRDGNTVSVYDPDGCFLDDRTFEYARTLCEMARRWKKARKSEGVRVDFDSDEASGFFKPAELKVMAQETSYDVIIHADGQVNVGCQRFAWEDINAFAKKEGLWK